MKIGLKMKIAKVLSICLLGFCSAVFAAPKEINVMVTVDWEGSSLDAENLEAIIEFRQKYPFIPMLQFLNPVYPLKFNDALSKINSTFLAEDRFGLHVHAWKTLTDKCQVAFKHAPAFDPTIEHCEIGDCGYSVSLEYAYDEPALTKLIACSSDMLVSQGYPKPSAFRAGGWQMGPKLISALQKNGINFDSSVTPAKLLSERWGAESEMVKLVGQLHPNASVLDAPYSLATGLMEYPNNASLADYTRSEQIVELFNALILNNKTVMVLGFHQETAVDYLHRLDEAIPEMEKIAKENKVKLNWVAGSN